MTDRPPTMVSPDGGLAGFQIPTINLVVVFADDAANGHAGQRFLACTDQRDTYKARVAAGVIAADDLGAGQQQMIRATAWAALTRTEQINMGWRDFDRDVSWCLPYEVEVGAVGAVGGVDPTRTATDS